MVIVLKPPKDRQKVPLPNGLPLFMAYGSQVGVLIRPNGAFLVLVNGEVGLGLAKKRWVRLRMFSNER